MCQAIVKRLFKRLGHRNKKNKELGKFDSKQSCIDKVPDIHFVNTNDAKLNLLLQLLTQEENGCGQMMLHSGSTLWFECSPCGAEGDTKGVVYLTGHRGG